MSIRFDIQSSDPAMLEHAARVAENFARAYPREGTVGIVFLGAIVRGYFDPLADIDVAIFKTPGTEIPLPVRYLHEEGFEIQVFTSDYAEDLKAPWGMSRRWAYANHRIFYDPDGLVARLLAEKVPLQAEERRWLMMAGMALSRWYGEGLPQLWVTRGNLVSAHHMFDAAITYFLDALFGLNNELVADVKWRYFCAEQLPKRPAQLRERIQEVLRVNAFNEEEANRRSQALLSLWNEALPWVEAELGMSYEAFSALV